MRCFIAAAIAVLLLGCNLPASVPRPPAQSAGPTESLGLQAVMSQALSCAATSLTWSVQEGLEAGSVTQDGIYTAPPCGSPYVDGPDVHVVAAGCNQSATAVVRVRQKVISVVITDCINFAMTPQACHQSQANLAGCETGSGGFVWWYATVTLTCSSAYSPPAPTSWPPDCT